MNLPDGFARSLLPFHAPTGCDSIFYIADHTNNSAWKVFVKQSNIVENIGEGDVARENIVAADKFMCQLYKVNSDSLDKARLHLFPKMTAPEKLPPTSDAFHHHILSVHFQATVWKEADKAMQELPDPEDYGWEMDDDSDQLHSILCSLDPVPCVDMVYCTCVTGCGTLICSCRKAKLVCTGLCLCHVPEAANPYINMNEL